MLSNFHFHHIGYAVTSIEKTMYYYIDGGYSCSSVIFDPIQNVNICFLYYSPFCLSGLWDG